METRAEQASSLDKRILLRLISAGFSLFVAGINDGSLGILIPWVIRDYGINTEACRACKDNSTLR